MQRQIRGRLARMEQQLEAAMHLGPTPRPGEKTSKGAVLLKAALKGDHQLVLDMYRQGASLSSQDKQGRTAFMCATDAGHTVTALLLLRSALLAQHEVTL